MKLLGMSILVITHDFKINKLYPDKLVKILRSIGYSVEETGDYSHDIQNVDFVIFNNILSIAEFFGNNKGVREWCKNIDYFINRIQYYQLFVKENDEFLVFQRNFTIPLYYYIKGNELRGPSTLTDNITGRSTKACKN